MKLLVIFALIGAAFAAPTLNEKDLLMELKNLLHQDKNVAYIKQSDDYVNVKLQKSINYNDNFEYTLTFYKQGEKPEDAVTAMPATAWSQTPSCMMPGYDGKEYFTPNCKAIELSKFAEGSNKYFFRSVVKDPATQDVVRDLTMPFMVQGPPKSNTNSNTINKKELVKLLEDFLKNSD